jgi:hypothetical protein
MARRTTAAVPLGKDNGTTYDIADFICPCAS